jgi:anaerobic selenocysteine-containing dehydrogenase
VVDGFEDFNARVRTAGGFHLHHPNRERAFPTGDGRAQFAVHALVAATGMEDAPLTLMTVRSHDQYNTTVYGLDDRYRGVHGLRRLCFISREDLQRHGFRDGELVDIVSIWNEADGVREREVHGFRLVEYDIPPGCLAAYFPETNPLVPLDSYAERARTPASKSIPVRLRKATAA